MLSEKEEAVLKKWIEWQAQASKTNALTAEMLSRIDTLKQSGLVTDAVLQNDTIYQELKMQHSIEEQKCDAPFKQFKEIVRSD